MKNYALLFIAGVFSFSGFAQQSDSTTTNKKKEKTQSTSNKMSNEELAVEAYHVEETINMTFGGRKTTYTVSSFNLVDTNELGQNNTRVVTPKYTKVKAKEAPAVINKLPVTPVVTRANVIKPVKVAEAVPKRKLEYITINIISSYERVLEKGYKTEDMLKAVADYHYFAGNLVTAAKWYSQLFEFCPDELDAVYYFRYAKSLDCIGQIKKAKEMMALFESKKL